MSVGDLHLPSSSSYHLQALLCGGVVGGGVETVLGSKGTGDPQNILVQMLSRFSNLGCMNQVERTRKFGQSIAP